MPVLNPIKRSDLVTTRSAMGVAARSRNPQRVVETSRNHAAAKLEVFIREVVAAAPPLTASQRNRLASILRTSHSGGTQA